MATDHSAHMDVGIAMDGGMAIGSSHSINILRRLIMRYVQALPGTGKTTLALSNHSMFIDSDLAIESISNLKPYQFFDKVEKGDKELLKRFKDLVLSEPDHIIVSNYDLQNLDPEFERIRSVGYKPDDYVAHIKSSNRDDLQEIDDDMLKDWALDYQDRSDLVNLQVGRYITAGLTMSGN